MEQSNRPDTPPIVDEQERAADSPLAARIRHARYLGAVRETALPDGSWDLLFVRKAGGPWTVIQTGQIAAPVEVNSDAGDEMLTIALRPEVYMPRLPGRLTLNRGVLRPVERDRFAVSPELNLNVLWHFTPYCKAVVGYSIVYWSNVVLAGNQIDPALDLSAGPAPTFPRFNFQRSDFLVQGINIGLDYRW